MGLKSGSKSGKGGKQSTLKVTSGKSQPSNSVDSDDEPDTDTSVLRPSIEISVSGVPQLVQAYNGATDELRSILTTECDIIYECRVCRNLFRSVANMMAHKRVYCKTTYSISKHSSRRNHVVEDYTVVIQPEPVPSSSEEKQNWSTSDKVPDDATQSNLANVEIVSSTSKIVSCKYPRKGLNDIVDKLKRNTCESNPKVTNCTTSSKLHETLNASVLARTEHHEHSFQLEDIDTSKVGKFQTKLGSPTSSSEKEDLMKAQVSELQNMATQNEAILGPDGKTIIANGISSLSAEGTDLTKVLEISTQKSSKDEHVCPDCNVKFSTRKTLNHHMKSLHVTFRLCYPCPCCKSTFVNPWSVYRHLYKVHRKTNAQVRRLRHQIQRKAFKKEISAETSVPETSSKTEVLKESQRLDQENQEWMDNFEEDLELQRCGGCGRRFERRAALNSHSQICQKRIAARNNVKVIQKVTPSTSLEKTEKPEIEVLEIETNKKNTNKNTDNIDVSPGTSRMRLSSNNSWTDSPKKEVPEKKIEIQIRKDYCKMSSASSVQALSTDTQSEPDSRPSSRTAEDDNFVDVQDWESVADVEEVVKEETDPLFISLEDQQSANVNDNLQRFSEPIFKRIENTRKRRACSKEQDTGISSSADDGEVEIVKHRKQQRANEQTIDNFRSSSSKVRRVEEFHPVMAARMQQFINLRRLQCLPCQKKFNKLTNLRRHVAVHIGWCRYKCSLCTFKCFSKYDCVDHVCKVHFKGLQRTKAASMVEYIKEQEVETENTKADVLEVKSHLSDSPSPDDEYMHEHMDSKIHSLNLEDIRNIVGVTSYPEELGKLTEVSSEHPEAPGNNSPDSVDSDVEILEVHSAEPEKFEGGVVSAIKHEMEDTREGDEQALENMVCSREIKQEIISEFVDVEVKMNVEPSRVSDVPYEEITETVSDNEKENEQGDKSPEEQELEADPLLIEPNSEEKVDESIERVDILEAQEEKIEVAVSEVCEKDPLTDQGPQTDPLNVSTQEEEEFSLNPVVVEAYSLSGEVNYQNGESLCLPEKESVIQNDFASQSMDQKLEENTTSAESPQTFITIKEERDDVEAEEDSTAEDFTSEGCSVSVSTVDISSQVNDKEIALRKMVMEVIFGSGDTSDVDSEVNQKLLSLSINGNMFDGERSDSSFSRGASPSSDVEIVMFDDSTSNHIASDSARSSVSSMGVKHENMVEHKRRERPVRNRVKVAKEDFIYDFSESFLKKEEAVNKTVSKKKHTDSQKPEEPRSVNVCKYVPKLMLVRTDGTDVRGVAKGTWSSVYTEQQFDSTTNKSSIATNTQTYNAARKPPHIYEP